MVEIKYMKLTKIQGVLSVEVLSCFHRGII